MNLKLDNIKRKKYLWDVEQLSFLWFCKSSTKQGPQLRFKKKKGHSFLFFDLTF